MIARRRPHDSCSGVELVQTILLSQIYAALSKVSAGQYQRLIYDLLA